MPDSKATQDSGSPLFAGLTSRRGDSPELVESMARTVTRLLEAPGGGSNEGGPTSGNRPAMLLGKIQSGKTRSFIGIIAKAFDKGVDFAIVLTKGTSALSEQTMRRITADFRGAIEDENVLVYDIMHLPKNLTRYHLGKKIIVVAKKQKDNLKRIFEALRNHYPDLQTKRLLIIDDEADYASLTYRRNTDTDELEPGKIARWVDDLRSATASTSFLQVTATPYSLYLQPSDAADTPLFHPVRPAFTELLPTHSTYVGGDFFFGEADDETSPAHFVYEEVSQDEREVLKKSDGRVFRLAQALTSTRIAVLRHALLTFVVATCTRRLQQEAAGIKRQRYSFIVHTEHSRGSHSWQASVVGAVIEAFVKAARDNPAILEELIKTSWLDLQRSMSLSGEPVPAFPDVLSAVRSALDGGELMVTVVNSDNQVRDQLDEEGQLRLDAPA
ncbi:MAG: hypothetical protein ABI577_17860, partial [bacterium]